jgi:hypothetical protein
MGFIIFPALMCLAAGAFYYAAEPDESPKARSVLVSLYGPIIGILFLTIEFARNQLPKQAQVAMFYLCVWAPPAFAMLSVIFFRGPRVVHFLLIPVALCYVLLVVSGLFGLMHIRL